MTDEETAQAEAEAKDVAAKEAAEAAEKEVAAKEAADAAAKDVAAKEAAEAAEKEVAAKEAADAAAKDVGSKDAAKPGKKDVAGKEVPEVATKEVTENDPENADHAHDPENTMKNAIARHIARSTPAQLLSSIEEHAKALLMLIEGIPNGIAHGWHGLADEIRARKL